MTGLMHEADYYEKGGDKKVRCLLCPHFCRIEEGGRGICNVRLNIGGLLFSGTYGLPVSIAIDPIEKKPLYHFFPEREILSIGTLGCNFSCGFCQNHTISQSEPHSLSGIPYTSPETVVREAQRSPSNIGIAYTYNEPVVFFEYMYDIAMRAAENNLKNVVVSNGYINPGPLEKLLEVTDAFNIDLKSFDANFYKDIAGGTLKPVKENLKVIARSQAHLEITFLSIPGLNDNEEEFAAMTEWIAGELGEATVLHISRYFPSWRMDNPPTPVSLIESFYQIAKKRLHFVYTGNMPAGSAVNNTDCPLCRHTVIKRSGYRVDASGLDPGGSCRYCGRAIAVRN